MIVFRRLKNLFSDHTCLQLPPSGFMNYHSFDKPPDDNQEHYGITPMNPKAFKKLIKQFQLGDSELPKRYIIILYSDFPRFFLCQIMVCSQIRCLYNWPKIVWQMLDEVSPQFSFTLLVQICMSTWLS